MASTICWHCHERAQMVAPRNGADSMRALMNSYDIPILFPDPRFAKDDKVSPFEGLFIYSCVNCGFPNIAEVCMTPEEAGSGYYPEDHIVRWLPIEPMGKDYPNAPDGIALIASEVHKCWEIGANRAAVILARSAVEGIVVDQEETPSTKKLYERIEDLKKAGKITSRTAEAATAIRLCGNDYVHNVLEPVDREYTEIVIQILDSIIDDLYSNPSLVSQAMAYAKKRRITQREEHNESNR